MQLFESTLEPPRPWLFHEPEQEEGQSEPSESDDSRERSSFDDEPATSQSPSLKKLLAKDAKRSLERNDEERD